MNNDTDGGPRRPPGPLRAIIERFAESMSRALGHARRTEQAFVVVIAIAVGLLAGGGAVGFRWVIKLAHRVFFGTFDYSTSAALALPWWERLALPAIGGLIAGLLVRYVATEVRGSGIPEVMVALMKRGGFIRARVALAKAVAAATTIASGGSAGREGPIVQIGASIGSAAGQALSVDAQGMRTFVACGAAAGIAATFNAPIAGALFAAEVILGDFAVLRFSAVVISSVSATVLSRHFLGDFPAFDVPPYELLSAREFLPYAVLGVLAGLVAVVFIRALFKAEDLFGRLKLPPFVITGVGGLLVGVIAIGLPEVYGVGYETLNDALWGRLSLWMLLLLPVAKLIATSATLGSGGSGGIFAPSLFLGAMIGGAVGHVAGRFMPGIADPGAYALVGMGAVVAGTTHGPISAILIIFELTNDYQIIPPLMTACILSVLLASWLQPTSIYTERLRRGGIDTKEGADVNVLRRLQVREVFDGSPVRFAAATPLREVIDGVIGARRDTFFVIDSEEVLLGAFTLNDLRGVMAERDLPDFILAADLVREDSPAVQPGDNLDLVMHLFGRHDIDEVAVLSDDGKRRLIGSVRHKDVIEAYNRQMFRLDLAGGFQSMASGVRGKEGVEVAAGYRLVEVEAPYGMQSRSIADLSVGARYGVQIIMINKPERDDESLPSRPGLFARADYVLKPGDRLLVLGAIEDIRRFRAGLPK